MKILKHNDYHFIRSSIGTFSSNISNINKTNTNTLVLNNNIPITGEDDKCVLFYDNTTKKLKAFVDNNEVEISFGNGGGGGDVPDYVLKYNHLNNTIEYEEDGIWKTLEFIENMREQIDELGWVNEKIIYDPINNIIQIKEVDNTIIESDLKINKNVIIGEDVTPTGDDSIMLHVGKNQPKTSINIDNYDGSSSFKMFGDNNLYEMTTDVNGLVFKNNDVEKLVIGNNYVGVNANTAITGFLNVGELITPTTDSIATINCSNDRNKINILNSYDEDVVINLNSSNSSSNNSNYSLYSKKNGDFELYNEKISKSILKVNDINSKISGRLGINIEPSNNSLDVDGTTRLRGAVTMDSTLTVDEDVNVTGTLHGYQVYSTMNRPRSVLASISQFLGTSQYSRFIIDNIRAGHTILRMRSYYDTTTNNKRGDWGFVLNKDNGEFQLHRYTSDAVSTIPLRINQDDNIGIGTAPTEGVKLDVNGDTMLRGAVTTDGAITTTKVNVMNGATTVPSIATISYFSGSNSNNERVVIDNTSGGNAAIRLRSVDDGNVNGDFGLAVNANGTAGIYKYEGATGGSYALLIDDTGNIGINTQSPTAKLDVNGDTRIRGQLTLNTPSTEGYLYRESSGVITTVAGPEPSPAEDYFELDTVYIPAGKVGLQYQSIEDDQSSIPVIAVDIMLPAGYYTVYDVIDWINSFMVDGKGLRAELLDNGHVRLWHWGINGGKTMMILEYGARTPTYELCLLLGWDPSVWMGPVLDVLWQDPYTFDFKQQLYKLKPKASIAWIPYSIQSNGDLNPQPVVRKAVFHTTSIGQDKGRTLLGTLNPIPTHVISITGSYETVSDGEPHRTAYSFGYRQHATYNGHILAEVELNTGNVYARVYGDQNFYLTNATGFWVVVDYIL